MNRAGYLSNSEYLVASAKRTTCETRRMGRFGICSHSVLRSYIVNFASNMKST